MDSPTGGTLVTKGVEITFFTVPNKLDTNPYAFVFANDVDTDAATDAADDEVTPMIFPITVKLFELFVKIVLGKAKGYTPSWRRGNSSRNARKPGADASKNALT